jgi:peptidoglycan/xylan/chitin deacetylase (PgdA/CDA1 family)
MDGEQARRAVKAAAAAALHYSGAADLLSGVARAAAGGRRLLILSYHRVVEDFASESEQAIPGLLITARTLERHILLLRRQGYELLSLEQALEVNAGLRRPRRDAAVLTFDDGYRDVYELGYPVLRRLGVPATVYLPTGYIGTGRRLPHDRLFTLLNLRRQRAPGPNRLVNRMAGEDWASYHALPPATAVDLILNRFSQGEVLTHLAQLEAELGVDSQVGPGALLDWEQCRTMQAGGISFGAHTVRHMALHLEPANVAETELRQSREEVERHLGGPCRDFAYPNGYYSSALLRSLAVLGFRSAVTTEDSLNRLGGDPLTLRRKTLWENHSLGPSGFSEVLTRCHVDSVFGMLGLARPVVGDRPGLLAGGEARA